MASVREQIFNKALDGVKFKKTKHDLFLRVQLTITVAYCMFLWCFCSCKGQLIAGGDIIVLMVKLLIWG
jgi:hypothetical protein